MSEIYELKAEPREGTGKGAARAVRRQGKIPAVIYGDKQPPIPIALSYKDVMLRIKAGGFLTRLANIAVNGETIRVIPKDYQTEPVRDFLLHVDFLRIAAGARITLDLPVHFVNEEESPGLERGGVLNIVRHTVEVEVLADSIPDGLVADLTGLDIGDAVHISSIPLPEGVEPTITDRDFTIATIAAPAVLTAEEEMGEEAAEEAEEAAEGEAEEGEAEEGEAEEGGEKED
jgi:large subunit ribosomal protein L25